MISPGFYNLVALENGGECHFGSCEVLEVEGHLIKVRQGREVKIMNTGASTFISATRVEVPSEPNPFAEFS